MGRRNFQVGSVGREIFFFGNIFFLSGGKNDSLKTQKSDVLLEEFWKNILSNFPKSLAKFSFAKNDRFHMIFAN